MAREAYLAARESAETQEQPIDGMTPVTESPFLLLPRELRDQIYMLLATDTPVTLGPLSGYYEPKIELLVVNKQIRAEYQTVFYKTLPDLFKQNRVCIKLANNEDSSELRHYCVGWHFWRIPGTPWLQLSGSAERRAAEGGLQIWMHRVPDDDETDIGWWMDVYQIYSENGYGSKGPLPPQVKEMARLFDKILKHSKVDGGKLRRVAVVQQRLEHTVGEQEAAVDYGLPFWRRGMGSDAGVSGPLSRYSPSALTGIGSFLGVHW